MAVNKFKNAASKLLAQHSLRPEEKMVYDPPTGKTAVTPAITRAIEPAYERTAMNPKLVDRRENNDITASKPILLKQEAPKKHEALPGDLVTELIKYIIVLSSALLGSAIAVFLVPEALIGFGGNIVLGLFGGTALGFIITKILLNS